MLCITLICAVPGPDLLAAKSSIRVDGRNVALLVPKKRPLYRAGYPLIVALHGAGGRGTWYQRSWQEFHEKFRLILAFPQARTTRWRHSDGKHVLALVKRLRQRYRIDRRRIYLVGFSRGGTYTYHFGLGRRSPFVALAPFAAGFVPLNKSEHVRRLPICLVHGRRDRSVRPERTVKMIALLRKRKLNVRIRLLSNVGHKHPDEANRWIWGCLDRRHQLRRSRRLRGQRRPLSRGMVRVRAGDTLWKLARRYRVSVPRLKTLNRLTSSRIRVGQRLRIR